MSHLYLAIAIVAEVIATSALNASNGFSERLPGAVAIVGYGIAFYCLSLVLKTLPVGIAYAIWCGLGIVLISLVGVFWFGQALDGAAFAGIGLIVAGVAIISLFSDTLARTH